MKKIKKFFSKKKKKQPQKKNESKEKSPPKKKFELPEEVRLPSSNEKLWNRVNSVKEISSMKELEEFIGVVKEKKCDLRVLKEALEDNDNEFGKVFFEKTCTFMLQTAQKLPEVFPQGIKIQKIGVSHDSVFTKWEAFCILCCSFFSFFERSSDENMWKLTLLPSINFDDMFKKTMSLPSKQEKTKIILNYFIRISLMTQNELEILKNKKITIKRIYKKKPDDILSFEEKPLCEVEFFSDGAIEDSENEDCLQVDFANRFIGGAVLSYGCVQEEIRFSLSPELIISRLICPAMTDDEAIIILGTEQFSNYKEYGHKVQYGGNFKQNEKSIIEIVAIDAVNYSYNPRFQFKEDQVKREFWKCYVGFSGSENECISTGNWGCGVFSGNVELKFLLQWISCSLLGKKMKYYTFGRKVKDVPLEELFQKEVQEFVKEKKITTSSLMKATLKASINIKDINSSFFKLVKQQFE